MVSITSHGGSCCGACHLFNFDTIVNSTTRGSAQEQILSAIQAAYVPVGRRIEVILNERQVSSRRGQEILDTLATLGFVLAEQYMNYNHNPPRKNFVFTRCDTRKRTDERLPFTWSGQWLTPNLHGDLPAVPAPTPAPTPAAERVDVTGITFGGRVNPNLPIVFEDGTPGLLQENNGRIIRVTQAAVLTRREVAGRRVNSGAWYTIDTGGYDGNEDEYQRIANYIPAPALAVGAVIEVTRRDSHWSGHTGTVTQLTDTNVHTTIAGARRSFMRTSVRVITAAPPTVAVPAAPEIEPQRHTQGTPPVVANRAAPPPPVVPPRVVYTTYHNVLQSGVGAGWETLEDCRGAAPRCRQQLRRDIMSDGVIVDTRL